MENTKYGPFKEQGTELKKLRNMCGLQQKAMAAKLGLSQAHLCHLEYGRFNPEPYMNKAREVFDEWKKGEIGRLSNKIASLQDM